MECYLEKLKIHVTPCQYNVDLGKSREAKDMARICIGTNSIWFSPQTIKYFILASEGVNDTRYVTA